MNENFYQYISSKLSVVETEIWNFNDNENKVVDPTLPGDDIYTWGMGIYLVPTGFCSKGIKVNNEPTKIQILSSSHSFSHSKNAK